MNKSSVLIVMGSDSDLPVMKDAANVLQGFGIKYEVHISSAHRVPQKTVGLVKSAEEDGIEVIIAAAGKAAHLAGVIAAHTNIPVIGVPMKTSCEGGLDSLYSTVQMPGGIPVATVAINGAKNAGILAAQILGIKYNDIREKLNEYSASMSKEVEEKDSKLQGIGIDAYLKDMK